MADVTKSPGLHLRLGETLFYHARRRTGGFVGRQSFTNKSAPVDERCDRKFVLVNTEFYVHSLCTVWVSRLSADGFCVRQQNFSGTELSADFYI